MCGLTHHPISHLLQRLCTRGARESSAERSAQGRDKRDMKRGRDNYATTMRRRRPAKDAEPESR